MNDPFAALTDPSLAQLARRWKAHLSEQDLAVITAAGYGKDVPLGEQPMLILVDFQHAYLGEDRPILEQLPAWPSAGGAGAWQALRTALPMIDAARAASIPIAFSRIAYPAQQQGSNPFVAKRGNGGGFIIGQKGAELADELHPQPNEYRVTKTAASVFYGTNLDEIIRKHAVDSMIVCGLSTSGCVRATVVDAAARGLRVAVAADASADRIAASHELALFDIWLKYGAVRTAEGIAAALQPRAAAESPLPAKGRSDAVISEARP
jgi:maleamate amidohydrolase